MGRSFSGKNYIVKVVIKRFKEGRHMMGGARNNSIRCFRVIRNI